MPPFCSFRSLCNLCTGLLVSSRRFSVEELQLLPKEYIMGEAAAQLSSSNKRRLVALQGYVLWYTALLLLLSITRALQILIKPIIFGSLHPVLGPFRILI